MAAAVLGRAGSVAMPLCVALSTFGAAMGSAFSGGRLSHAAAMDRLLPAWLAASLAPLGPLLTKLCDTADMVPRAHSSAGQLD